MSLWKENGMKNKLDKILVLVTALLVVACSVTEGPEVIQKVSFQKINIEKEIPSQYSFLSQIKKSIEENRSRYRSFSKNNLKYEGEKFEFPNISVGESKLGDRDIILVKISGGTFSTYCSGVACTLSVYIKRDGEYFFLGNILSSDPYYLASCKNHEYLVSGSGAGIDPSFLVWSIKGDKLAQIVSIDVLKTETICHLEGDKND